MNAFIMFTLFPTLFSASAFGRSVTMTVQSSQPLVQQTLELTITADTCAKYNGPDSCVVAFRSLSLPAGGRIVSVLRSSNPEIKISLNLSSEDALSGIAIAGNAAVLDQVLSAGALKARVVYNGPAIH